MDETSSDKLRMPDGTVLAFERHGNGSTAILSMGVSMPAFVGYTLLLVHPRGYGASEGAWFADGHMKDVQQLITHFKTQFSKVYVIATGEQARLLLLHELEEGVFPDGMILLEPENVERLHVQTPTVIFTNTLLQLWNATVRSWPPATLERAHVLREALEELDKAERPIRFRAT
jgi:hypothetical protein